MRPIHRHFAVVLLATVVSAPATARQGAPPAAASDRFQPMDVFGLEWASDPQISPDGRRIAYVRNSMDVMTDRRRSQVWLVGADGGDHHPLTSGNSEFAPLVCEDCAEVCKWCKEECERHDAEHCQECARACTVCMEQCLKMTA